VKELNTNYHGAKKQGARDLVSAYLVARAQESYRLRGESLFAGLEAPESIALPNGIVSRIMEVPGSRFIVIEQKHDKLAGMRAAIANMPWRDRVSFYEGTVLNFFRFEAKPNTLDGAWLDYTGGMNAGCKDLTTLLAILISRAFRHGSSVRWTLCNEKGMPECHSLRHAILALGKGSFVAGHAKMFENMAAGLKVSRPMLEGEAYPYRNEPEPGSKTRRCYDMVTFGYRFA